MTTTDPARQAGPCDRAECEELRAEIAEQREYAETHCIICEAEFRGWEYETRECLFGGGGRVYAHPDCVTAEELWR